MDNTECNEVHSIPGFRLSRCAVPEKSTGGNMQGLTHSGPTAP